MPSPTPSPTGHDIARLLPGCLVELTYRQSRTPQGAPQYRITASRGRHVFIGVGPTCWEALHHAHHSFTEAGNP